MIDYQYNLNDCKMLRFIFYPCTNFIYILYTNNHSVLLNKVLGKGLARGKDDFRLGVV